MGLIKTPKTPQAVGQLAVAEWFHTGCSAIIWNKVDIALVVRLVNTYVQILKGETCMIRMQ